MRFESANRGPAVSSPIDSTQLAAWGRIGGLKTQALGRGFRPNAEQARELGRRGAKALREGDYRERQQEAVLQRLLREWATDRRPLCIRGLAARLPPRTPAIRRPL